MKVFRNVLNMIMYEDLEYNSLEMEIKFSSFTLRLINFIKSPITCLWGMTFHFPRNLHLKQNVLCSPKRNPYSMESILGLCAARQQIAINEINLSSYEFRLSCEIEIFYVNAIAIILRSNGRGQGRENIAGKLQSVPGQ